MTRCTRCHRRLKAPTPSGMGPVCAAAVLGQKAREPEGRRVAVRKFRDEATADLFDFSELLRRPA